MFHYQVLFGKFSGTVTGGLKEKCWGDVARKVTSVSGVQRAAGEVKKKWACMKSGAKSAGAAAKRSQQRTGVLSDFILR